jgi:hypothetical protein
VGEKDFGPKSEEVTVLRTKLGTPNRKHPNLLLWQNTIRDIISRVKWAGHVA